MGNQFEEINISHFVCNNLISNTALDSLGILSQLVKYLTPLSASLYGVVRRGSQSGPDRQTAVQLQHLKRRALRMLFGRVLEFCRSRANRSGSSNTQTE